MRDVDTAMVLRLVAENAKQRFELFYGIDPSPPKPKVKKGQNKGQGKGEPAVNRSPYQVSKEDLEEGESKNIVHDSATVGNHLEGSREKDAAEVDDLSKNLKEASISTELPLIALPAPTMAPEEVVMDKPTGEWFIRATQGHSIKLESVAHLTPVLDDEDGRSRAGVCVHGTRWELWDTLRKLRFSPPIQHKTHPPEKSSTTNADPSPIGSIQDGQNTHPPGSCSR